VQSKAKMRLELAICFGVIVAALGTVLWMTRHPAVNRAQARAMTPALEAYMHGDVAGMGLEGDLDARLKPQAFCDPDIIEIRPDGAGWRVGMMPFCASYARRDGTLLESSVGYDIVVAEVTIRSGHYQVLSFQVGSDGYDPAWVHANFSSLAARWILSTDPPTAPDPVGQARRALGFPADTPAVQQ
jgi:hypothetical protein